MINRYAIKFGGQSGQGINTLGEILAKSIKNTGYHTFAYREYPSLIKGGYASYQTDFSTDEILSSSQYTNILACIAPEALHQYIPSVQKGGTIIHSIQDFQFTSEESKYIEERKIDIVFLDTVKIVKENNAPDIMANVVILGYIWKVVGFDLRVLEHEIKKYFGRKKNIDINAEIRCIKAGYNFETEIKGKEYKPEGKKLSHWNRSKVLTGNEAIALGAISAGCRAYYGYPMTPTTDILKLLGSTYMQTGIVVKQAESEITGIQMVMGSMYMGTRAFTATSGGGFDLMTETISCSGMTETPLVIVLGQRQGPGTGVPTWTGSGDLNAALHAGHGEFPRCILASSDAKDSYELIQHAFNIAEQYQIPVVLLCEKQNAESLFNIKDLPKPLKIQRGFKDGTYRYEITPSGISPRWIPQKSKRTYLVNSDEHSADGISTEDPNIVVEMTEKRMRKLLTLEKNIPQPTYYGPKEADIVFVGMGTTKNTVLDTMKQTDLKIGYLHYQYIYPLKYQKILDLYEQGSRIVLIENNQTGEFGKLIKQESTFEFPEKLLKFDSRPFFVEDILDFLKQ